MTLSNTTGSGRGGSGPRDIEAAIRRQVEQLAYLPGSAAVAIKFIEIGKDPDAGPADYDKIISSDVALSSKLLSLANSSWYATRHEVTKVLQAVNLLGINNVRTLAISYCMTGMYNRLKIPKEEVDRYWQASLCKGVAAKTYAHAFEPALEDQAFMSGLFQDMALPVMHAAAKPVVLAIVEDDSLSTDRQIAEEREKLGIDHTEVGRQLATKLELPESYIDAIAFHHDGECIQKFCTSPVLASAVHVAGMFPHLPLKWHAKDIEALTALLAEHTPDAFPTLQSFLDVVQKEFDQLFDFFQPGKTSQLHLNDLIAEACEELADATGAMMGQMNTLMAETAKMGAAVSALAAQHEQLSCERLRDPLTKVFNRVGFLEEAVKCMRTAARYARPLALMYFDIDKFKSTNDVHGHHYGDFVLRELSDRVAGQLRKGDILGRVGGDEFVILLQDVDADQIRDLSDAIMKAVRHEPYAKGKVAENKTISLGVLCVPGEHSEPDIDTLINEADALMYMAKRAAAGQIRMRTFTGTTIS